MGTVGQAWNKYVSKDYKKLNLESWQNFFAAHGTTLNADQIDALKMMYSILLYDVGYGSIAQDNWGISENLIKDYIKYNKDSEKQLFLDLSWLLFKTIILRISC